MGCTGLDGTRVLLPLIGVAASDWHCCRGIPSCATQLTSQSHIHLCRRFVRPVIGQKSANAIAAADGYQRKAAIIGLLHCGEAGLCRYCLEVTYFLFSRHQRKDEALNFSSRFSRVFVFDAPNAPAAITAARDKGKSVTIDVTLARHNSALLLPGDWEESVNLGT